MKIVAIKLSHINYILYISSIIKTLTIMSNLKNLSIYTLLIAAVIALVAFIIPAMIKGFFLALGWMINNPALGLVISITFLLGCFVGNLKVAK